MATRQKTFGPPGAGKTTYLQGNIRRLHAGGVKPDEIAFTSFTRQARQVAQEKVMRELGITAKEAPHYRTLHAHAFHALDMRSDEVVSGADFKEFAKSYHYDITPEAVSLDPDDAYVDERNERPDDHLKAIYEWCRNRLLDLDNGYREYARLHQEVELPPLATVQRFIERYEKFKGDLFKRDYTDMLIEALNKGAWPAVKWLIVDEAQDLNPLQMTLVLAWADECEGLLMAGDPDQAVFTFMGAAPHLFNRLKAERHELHKSFRLPERVHAEALRVRARMSEHSGVDYTPVGPGGRVDREEWGLVPLRQWLDGVVVTEGMTPLAILARTNYLVERWVNVLMDEGIPYRRVKGASPLDARSAQLPLYHVMRKIERREWPTYQEWHDFLAAVPVRGDRLIERGTRNQVEQIILAGGGSMPASVRDLAGFGVLPDFEEAINAGDWNRLLRTGKVNHAHLEYYARVERKWGLDALSQTPPVVVSTIHGFKGGEAEHVVVDLGITRRVQQGFDFDPDTEYRVGYVGVSRATKWLTYIAGTERRQAPWAA